MCTSSDASSRSDFPVVLHAKRITRIFFRPFPAPARPERVRFCSRPDETVAFGNPIRRFRRQAGLEAGRMVLRGVCASGPAVGRCRWRGEVGALLPPSEIRMFAAGLRPRFLRRSAIAEGWGALGCRAYVRWTHRNSAGSVRRVFVPRNGAEVSSCGRRALRRAAAGG